MARRKKEPQSVHRESIAAAAEKLFSSRGTAAVTMDEIAGEAGYSKATLYVYFSNKEGIIAYLALKSMKLLHSLIAEAVSGRETTEEKYRKICEALIVCLEQYPLSFSLALGKINVRLDRGDCLLEEREAFEVGEKINGEIAAFLREGIDAGEFQPDIPVLPTVFLFWASLSGLIQMAANKEKYIEAAMGLSKDRFLEFGFERLYRMIAEEGRA